MTLFICLFRMIELVYQNIQVHLNNLEYHVTLVYYNSKVKTHVNQFLQTDTRLLLILIIRAYKAPNIQSKTIRTGLKGSRCLLLDNLKMHT